MVFAYAGTPFKYIIPYLEKRSTILLECPAVFLIGDQLFDFLITNYLGRCVIRIDIANHATSEMNILNYVDSVLSSEEKSGILNEKDIQFVFLIENVDLLPLQSRSLSDIGLNSFQNPLVVCTCNLGLEKRYRKEALEFFFGSHKILEFETIQSSIKEFFPDVAKICEAGQTEDPLFVPDMNSLSRFVNFYVEEGIKAVARTHPKLYSFVTAMIERQIVVVKDGKSDSEKDRVDGTVSSSSDSKIDNLRDDQSRLETSELTSKSKGKDYEKWKEEQGKEKEIQIKLVETVIEFCGTLAKDGLLQNQRDQEILISKFDQMSLEYFCLLCAPLQMNYVASSEADKPSYPAPTFVPQPDTQSTPAYIFPPLPCSVTFLYPSLFYFFVLLHVFDTTNIQTPREEKFVRYFRFLELPEIDEQLALYFVQAIKVQLIWKEIIDSFKSETLSDMYFATYPKLLHSYNFDYKKPLSNIKKLEDLLIQHSNVNSNNFNNTSNSNSNTTNNSNNNNNSPPVVSPRTVFQGQPKESIVRALQLHKLYSLWPRPIFATSYLVSNREHGKETAKLGILTYIWFGLCALFGYIVEDFNKESREIKGNKEKEKEIMKEISEIG